MTQGKRQTSLGRLLVHTFISSQTYKPSRINYVMYHHHKFGININIHEGIKLFKTVIRSGGLHILSAYRFFISDAFCKKSNLLSSWKALFTCLKTYKSFIKLSCIVLCFNATHCNKGFIQFGRIFYLSNNEAKAFW